MSWMGISSPDSGAQICYSGMKSESSELRRLSFVQCSGFEQESVVASKDCQIDAQVQREF